MPAPDVRVACLCAAWCQLCAGYRATFEGVAAQLAAAGAAPPACEWVDIEDSADLIDDLDVETFPTLLIFDERDVRFFGPIGPQPEVLLRILRNALDAAPDSAWPEVAPAVQALAERLRHRPSIGH